MEDEKMHKPDFIAHMSEVIQEAPKRPWMDRIMGEGLRLFFVLVVALGVSYVGLNRELEGIKDAQRQYASEQRVACLAQQSVQTNQQTVLLTLLTMIDAINDSAQSQYAGMPPSARIAVLKALSSLPDPRVC